MKKLISMVAFVKKLEQSEEFKNWLPELDEWFNKCCNYTDFLSQKLELWMFVPCDLGGNVLQEPLQYKSFIDLESEMDNETPLQVLANCRAFKEAKDRVLFEGFQVNHLEDRISFISEINIDNVYIVHYSFLENRFLSDTKTIEDLIKYNLELTPTAQKQIGL